MTLGECINQYLTEKNMSMRTFAALAGVSHSYVSYIVNGKTSRGDQPVPTIDKYRAFAKAMGIDVNQLIAMVDDSIGWAEKSQPGDDELADELQILRDNPETRALLKGLRNMSPEQVRRLSAWIESMNDGG